MLTISKALSAGQAQTYHSQEFTSEEQNYWSQDRRAHSEWQGKLAEDWDLTGPVGAEHFARLSEGQHPETGEQMVKHQTARTYENEYGREITSTEHRAGWDATFSAPKSVSLTALVGGDDRIREAHRESVRVALGELERYTQARMGNTKSPETTGKFVAATFEHDTARPVEGYAAPQLHTHAVVFNVTVRENGQTRALQERSLFQSQHYVTSVYRSELAARLQGLGYSIERGKYGQPEIKGYTQEYLDASSPRREQIKEHLQSIGMEGAGAAQVAAHRTRDQKDLLPQNEVLRQHRELSARYGHQPDRVVAEARQHTPIHSQQPEKTLQQAVTYARSHVFERSAVRDERMILHSVLDRGMGNINFQQAREELERRVNTGEFRILGPQDPRRHTGVSVYRDEQRAFSAGDRVQITAPNQDLKIANRELGIITAIDDSGKMALRLDSGRDLRIDPQRHPHLDHGYAVTSYSGQGQTADRVLIHVDTDLPAKDLINNRMAYVAVSRGATDAQIFTNDRGRLAEALSRDVSHESAHKAEKAVSPVQQDVAQSQQPARPPGIEVGIGV